MGRTTWGSACCTATAGVEAKGIKRSMLLVGGHIEALLMPCLCSMFFVVVESAPDP